MAEYLLGIDSGTTACKSVLFDLDGHLVAEASAEYGVHYPRPTWAEQDPNSWWNAAVETTRRVLNEAKALETEILGVGVDSQREAVVPVDADGNKLDNGIIWLDSRTIDLAQSMKDLIPRRTVIEVTGVDIDYLYSAAKILWIMKMKPKVFAKTKCFLCTKDYIVSRLTGEKVTDYSSASRTMLFDINRLEWAEGICQALDIPMELLPEVKPSWEVIGEVTSKASEVIGLRKRTPVVGGGGDRPCESLGAGMIEPGRVNIGTGAATTMTTVLTKPNPDSLGKVDCCCHVVPDAWEYDVSIRTTGASLRWFRDNFAKTEVDGRKTPQVNHYVCFDDLAKEADAGCGNLFFYPYIMGARAPKFNNLARGVFFGFTMGHTKADFIRAILEGVAFQYPETFELLERLGVRFREASMVGGETRSDLWNRIKADISGKKIVIPEVSQAAALGSAILAGLGVKVYRDARDAVKRAVRFANVYEPIDEHVMIYKELHRKYKEIYELIEKGYALIA